MKNILKHLTVASALGFPLMSFAADYPSYHCQVGAPCVESFTTQETKMELGESRPLEMVFEDANGTALGLTYSEIMAMGRKFLWDDKRREFFMFRRMNRGQALNSESLPHVSYDKYQTVDVTLINEDLLVIIVKPEETLVLQRGADSEVRVELQFDQFISMVKQAFAHYFPQKVEQGSYGNHIMNTDIRTLRVNAIACSAGGSGSSEAVQNAINAYVKCRDNIEDRMAEEHRDDFADELKDPQVEDGSDEFYGGFTFSQRLYERRVFLYDAVSAYYDREGESLRDLTYSKKTILDLGVDQNGNPIRSDGGFVQSSLSINGKKKETEVEVVQPQVKTYRREADTRLNGKSKSSKKHIIDILNKRRINKTHNSRDWNNWLFK